VLSFAWTTRDAAHAARLAAQGREDGVKSGAAAVDRGHAGPLTEALIVIKIACVQEEYNR